MAGRPLNRFGHFATDPSPNASISISIRGYDDSIERAYAALFPDDLAKTSELLRWRFLENPHGPAKFSIAERGGDVVGLIALVPTRLRKNSEHRMAFQAIDTMVHPSCRGQGLFVKMAAAAQDPAALGGEILWGFPNANAAPGWYGRLGWTNFGAVPLLIRPLRLSFLLRQVHRKLKALDLPLVRARRSTAKHYSDKADLGRDFDELWKRVAPTLGMVVDRGGQWLRWRLLDKPGVNYRCSGALSGTGQLDAFVASKSEEKHGARLCYVMEAIGAPDCTAALVELLKSEVAVAAGSGAEAALAWCPRTAPNYAAYRKAGFVPVPPRFRPIEINFGARALAAECVSDVANGAGWYISFLDSDTN